MLLSLIRKHAQSWLIKAIIAIIAIVFVLYFGSTRQGDRNAKTAKVNGELITTQEYKKTYYNMMEMFKNQYKGIWNDDLIKSLDVKTMALNNMIIKILINQEAERLGLAVTKKEVQNSVLKYAAFQLDGQFDMRRYQTLLDHNRMTPEKFENDLEQELLSGKLRQFLDAFITLTDNEVQDDYEYNNEKIKISFIHFKPDQFKDTIQPDEAAMNDLFEEQKEKYRIPKKIKIEYLEIDPNSFKEGIEIPDSEVKSYYEYNIDLFSKPKQVRARHILFKLDEKTPEEEAKKIRTKAESVLKEAREGKNFAELAKKYSEGPSKTKGGDLGYFSSGQMVKAFQDEAFKMKSGDISDLVRTKFGYHIIKIEDIKEAQTKVQDEARKQIVKTLTENTAMELAYEKGQILIDQMPYDTKLSEYASEHALETKFTDYLSQDDPIHVIGNKKELKQTIFTLEINEISELIELRNKYYIFQVSDIKNSYLPEIKAVADKVKKDLIGRLALREAKSAADKFLDHLKNGKAWDELAKEKELKIEKTDFFTRKGYIPKIGYEPELNDIIFKLNENKRHPDTIFENNKGSYVVRWEEDKTIDEKKFQEEKDKQRLSLMQKKRAHIFESWVENLKKDADIEIITRP